MADPNDMVQAITDGLTLAQTADRGVSVDDVRDAQKQALAAFSDGDVAGGLIGCWNRSGWRPMVG